MILLSRIRNSPALYVLFAFLLSAASAFPCFNVPDTDMSSIVLPESFEEQLEANAFDNSADVRIMSANVLVDFDWGLGINPAPPRAAKFFKVLETYRPDVIGVQEQSEAWSAVFIEHLPDEYKLINPVSTYLNEKMSTLVYNADTLKLIDSGDYKFSFKGADKKTRRVAWGVFEVKETGKRFGVTNTHLDFITDEMNFELRLQEIGSEVDEMLATVDKIIAQYNCPVFSPGDYNTYESAFLTGPYTEIYSKISGSMTDSKFNCERSTVGDLTEIIEGSFNQDCISMDMQDVDHIFYKGNTSIRTFALLSYSYLYDMTDHNLIFVDAVLK